MIPLSNGRSPRIDQFYATIRTYKSHHFHQDSHEQSEQDKSIQFIRSVGKQIIEDVSMRHKKSIKNDSSKAMFKSSESLMKSRNLYDKYKEQADKKVIREINNTKQNIIKQQIDKIPQKIKKDKKYEQVSSKIQQKSGLKGLNYVKRTDLEVQKLKNNKIQTERIQKQIKQKQAYFQRNMKIYKNSSKQFLSSGLLKRTQEIQARKVKCVERIRTEQREKEMKGVTFQPEMISKRINIEQSFQKRSSIAKIKKLSNEKEIIKQVMHNHTFYPQTNRYKDSESKIIGLWKQETGDEKNKSKFLNTLKIEEFDEGRENSYKQQQTANSTTRINLRSLNQLSFIFQ